VVDNHSTDGTDDVVRKLGNPNIDLHKIRNDGVIAASRNLGIRRARGEYVAFLDSDDWWLPQKLQESAAALASGADVVYHALFVVTTSGQKTFRRQTRTRDLKLPVFTDLLVNGNALDNSSVVVRRRVLEEIGGFCEDRNMISAEDYDGWLRAAKVTERFTRIPRTLGYYWAGGGNVSNPERTIATADILEQRYSPELKRGEAAAKLYYLNYTRGRAWYRLKQFARAKENLERARGPYVPFMLAVKRQWMLASIDMRLRLAGDRLKGK